jgi:putative membrane protein
MWGWYSGMGWWMVIGSIWMVVFWGAIIWLVVWGIRALTGGQPRRDEGDTPLEIARKRLARGEITREQFEELRKALQ